MECPCSSHLFCLLFCSDIIVNGLILAVFIAMVKVSFFDKSIIQLKSKLTVTLISILETRDSIWIESWVSHLLLSGTVLCLQQAFSPLELLYQEIVLCQSCSLASTFERYCTLSAASIFPSLATLSGNCPVSVLYWSPSGYQVAICCAGAVLVDLLWGVFSHKDTEQTLHFCRVYIK